MKLKLNINAMRYFYSLLIGILLFNPTNIFSQTDVSDDTESISQEKFNNWNITLNGGATILWGDLNDEPSNPFGNYFNDHQGWGYGVIVTRRFGNTFSANLQYLGSNLKGYRSTWSNDSAADLSFESKIHDISLNLEVDILNLILESKERRWFSAYLKGGVGYVFYSPSVFKTSDGTPVYSGSGASLVIPWGWGAKADISKHWSIRFENTFHHTFVDDVEGHGTIHSDVNDIYSYTSLGVTYRIYQSPKQPKLPKEEDIEEVDTTVAEVVEVEPPFELSIAANIPSTLHPFDTSDVTLRITKGDIDGKAKLQQTIPEGFKVKELLSAGAVFEYKNQIMSFSWEELPEKEIIEITYRLISSDASIGTHSIPGIMFYIQDDVDQIRQFKKTLEIKATDVVAETNPQEEPTPEPEVEPAVVVPVVVAPKESTDGKSLVYRVQVYAVYGGTTSSKLLQSRLNLDYEVKQDYQGDYAKYTSGEFATYEEAAAYKKKLRNSTVPGAFVVGFYEGARTKNIQEAIAIENGGQAATKASIPMGIIYRVQVFAAAKNMSVESVKNQTGVTDDLDKVTHNGLFKYEVGAFKSYSDAKAALQRVRESVSDAFIVKYQDGNRI